MTGPHPTPTRLKPSHAVPRARGFRERDKNMHNSPNPSPLLPTAPGTSATAWATKAATPTPTSTTSLLRQRLQLFRNFLLGRLIAHAEVKHEIREKRRVRGKGILERIVSRPKRCSSVWLRGGVGGGGGGWFQVQTSFCRFGYKPLEQRGATRGEENTPSARANVRQRARLQERCPRFSRFSLPRTLPRIPIYRSMGVIVSNANYTLTHSSMDKNNHAVRLSG